MSGKDSNPYAPCGTSDLRRGAGRLWEAGSRIVERDLVSPHSAAAFGVKPYSNQASTGRNAHGVTVTPRGTRRRAEEMPAIGPTARSRLKRDQ
jgi:hypothetical protein